MDNLPIREIYGGFLPSIVMLNPRHSSRGEGAGRVPAAIWQSLPKRAAGLSDEYFDRFEVYGLNISGPRNH
jgi:hypothetical protein